MVEIFDNRVIISNPGGLPGGLDIKNFGKISIARNSVIASLIQRSNYIEKMGTGINRIYNTTKKAGLLEPEFSIEGFFIVTLKKKSFVTVGVNVGAKFKLNKIQHKIIKEIKNSNIVSAETITELLEVTSRTIERNIKLLKEKV